MTEAADSALSEGTMVGAYRIEYRLGGGGMGTVYAAEEPTIKKRVAIKVLRHAFADDAASTARFEREARAANDVKHPGIVDVFAFGKLPDGRPYLVMSLLEGRSLREEIAARGKLPPAEAWAIAREVAEALAAAHEAGIVHRDLKPDNVFLERMPKRSGANPAAAPARPRILDFGLAKVQASDDEAEPMKLTQSGVPMGTPAYMAPEQWWGAAIDARTDQYAFGTMLFQMIAGRPPFGSQQYLELAQQHLHAKPPSLVELDVGASAEIDAFVSRTLAKSAAQRFGSMAELLEAGDAAFGVGSTPRIVARPAADPASDDTLLATPALALRSGPARAGSGVALPASLVTAPPIADPVGRFVKLHVAILVVGVGAIALAGYAGVARHQMREWLKLAGWGGPLSVALFLVAGIVMVRTAKVRAQTGTPTLGIWWLVLWSGINGAAGTYTGWLKVGGSIHELPVTLRFTVYNIGMYEANASRFLGFWLSAVLAVSLAALPGISGASRTSTTLVAGLGVRRRESIAAAVGLVALAVIAVVVGAPSGALIAGVAAAALGVGLALPAVHPETAARDELERAIAGLAAVGLATAVGFARLEAREAIVWDEQPTRAARAAEIVAAAGERTATTAIALASLAVVIALEVLRIRRLLRRATPVRPLSRTWPLLAALSIVLVADVSMHARFLATRDLLRKDLDAQFSLFARLDPPSGEALDPKQFAPHAAPALQIARDRIAINGAPIAKLVAVDAQAANVSGELAKALAMAGEAQPDAPDLSVSVDRDVPYRSVRRLLEIAHGAGAAHIELLLTRGPAPSLPANAPPETAYAIATDFVALEAHLAEQGASFEADAPFGKIAPELVRRALAEPGPLELAAPVR